MNAADRKEAAKRGAAKALLSLDNDGARAILSEAPYTPGPWRTSIDQDGLHIYASVSYSVAKVYHGHVANARLITEAPAMLEALRAYVARINDNNFAKAYVPEDVRRNARALLKRIDGG